MSEAPHATPPVLAQHPLSALFWAFAAPMLFPALATFVLITILGPGQAWMLGGERQWQVMAVSHLALFALMSRWSEQVGAGAFAAPVRAHGDWVVMAGLLGPLVLHGTALIVALAVAGGDPNWMYRDGADTRMFSPDRLTPSLVAFAVILAPVVEEIAFRGIALGCLLARGWSPLTAAALTSAGFAAVHMQYAPVALIPVFAAGLLFAWLRIRSGSIGPAIVAHASANALALVLFAVAEGQV